LEAFVASSHIASDSFNNPQSMRDTPSSATNTTTYVHECSIKKRARETEEPVVSQQDKKKGKKFQFFSEEVTVPRKPVTRSTTKGIRTIHTS
jgi:hypothetical protein